MPMSADLLAPLLIFVVAILYSSVGHGGASGYLMVMSVLAYPARQMTLSALVLNIAVAGIAFLAMRRAGLFSWSLCRPFLLTSIPSAFLGGLVVLSDPVYSILLGLALMVASLRLLLPLNGMAKASPFHQPHPVVCLAAGAGIGLLSGMIGIGGGIFLSPLLILAGWADPKSTAGVSSCFILMNSIAGLAGKFTQGFDLSEIPVLFVVSAVAGGLIGSSLGARTLSMKTLRQLLAVVLLIVSGKLCLQ